MMFALPRGRLLQEGYRGGNGGLSLLCPITQQPLLLPGGEGEEAEAQEAAHAEAESHHAAAILASDGQLYLQGALMQWMRECEARGKPPTSPVTREVLRPWGRRVVPADSLAVPAAGIVRLHAFAPPFSLHTPRIGGVVQMSAWDDRPGVLARMLLGWQDGDALEWQLPVTTSAAASHTPATPPPCEALLPLVAPLLRWWGGGGGAAAAASASAAPASAAAWGSVLSSLASPEHLLTAPIRIVTDEGTGKWTTMEEALLALNVAAGPPASPFR